MRVQIGTRIVVQNVHFNALLKLLRMTQFVRQSRDKAVFRRVFVQAQFLFRVRERAPNAVHIVKADFRAVFGGAIQQFASQRRFRQLVDDGVQFVLFRFCRAKQMRIDVIPRRRLFRRSRVFGENFA